MIIGFVLLITSCAYDYCKSDPVSERIYQTEQECEVIMRKLQDLRPRAVLACGQVWREG